MVTDVARGVKSCAALAAAMPRSSTGSCRSRHSGSGFILAPDRATIRPSEEGSMVEATAPLAPRHLDQLRRACGEVITA
ncbi:MAG TPA: hypothetical protein VFJ71_05525, partial [Candidatus Limnocylindrales bacterium]|nr:hypothetical protein [Candidatus Limnocylindrales bacterium]